MAVPFALPEDEINNLIVAVIFILSQTRLNRTEKNRELQECMEELVRLLADELGRRQRSSEYDDQLRQTLMLLGQSLTHFTTSPSEAPRRWSQESYCDDCKLFLQEDCPNEECSQVGLILRKFVDGVTPAIFEEDLGEKEDCVESSFLSRLVPGVRRTFWTAFSLICVVGWHLFQTSYSV